MPSLRWAFLWRPKALHREERWPRFEAEEPKIYSWL